MTEPSNQTREEQHDVAMQAFITSVEVLALSGYPWPVIYTAMVDVLARLLISGIRDIGKRARFVTLFTELAMTDLGEQPNGKRH